MRRLLLLALVAGCTTDPPQQDGGIADAGHEDSGIADTGEADSGVETDAGLADGGPSDAGPPPLGPVNVDISAGPPELLSAFNFFRYADGRFEYNEGVVPYDLNTPLFSDFALKARAIYVPPGSKIQFHDSAAFELPVGSAVIKSFLFAEDLRRPAENVRIIETRVLVRYADGWRPFPYLWRSDESDADHRPGGHTEAISFIDPLGNPRTSQYLVPQRNQCFECHELQDENGEPITVLLGPKARHLNRFFTYDGVAKNQLEHLADLGVLEGLPDLTLVEQAFDFSTLYETGTTSLDAATLEKAARDYLDINCAHCHNPSAVQGVTSQLFLNYDNTDAFRLGVCKSAGSAGSGTGDRRYDVIPGDPEGSILWYRMQTETVGEMMPLIGRSLADDLGIGLIHGWIEGLPGGPCE